MSKIFPISQINSFLLQKFEKSIPLYQNVCFTGSLVTVNHVCFSLLKILENPRYTGD